MKGLILPGKNFIRNGISLNLKNRYSALAADGSFSLVMKMS